MVVGRSSRLELTPAGGIKPIHWVITSETSDPSVPFSLPGVNELAQFRPFE